MKGLHWFRNDLRLTDNPGLVKLAAECDELLLLYVVDTDWFQRTAFETQRMGLSRQHFIKSSLADLQQSLNTLGQRLLVIEGKPEHVLTEIIETYQPDMISATELPATFESRQLAFLQGKFPDIHWSVNEAFTLFTQSQLPFHPQELPESFTPFRKQVEAVKVKASLAKPAELPAPPPDLMFADGLQSLADWSSADNELIFLGGESAALQQLHYYLHESKLVKRYKKTRNELDGWDFSSKLSTWLAQGCLSARKVMDELYDFEEKYGANESTYWLYFELLWREYFQWLHVKYQHRLYQERGIRNIDPCLKVDNTAFAAWKNGKTESAFVNAFMHQLQQTGWMSNRGRQIVASYLINQLGVDWRWGAAWFEEQLIDYDPASNYGNWQYLAGVGTDPRGRRAFNIDKQQRQYDPEGDFIKKYARGSLS